MNLNEELEKYISEHISEEDELLKEINRQTHLKMIHPRMLSGHIQGKLLEMLSKMINPKNILEIGTYTGYSALCLAKGLQKNGKLITIEINDELQEFTQNFFNKSSYTNQINFLIGDALEIIPNIDTTFDLVFIDGDKSSYIEYFDTVIEKVHKNGFIIADNTLWSGKVLEKNIKNNDYFTKGIIKFNDYVRNNSKVDVALIPVRDGITILQKK